MPLLWLGWWWRQEIALITKLSAQPLCFLVYLSLSPSPFLFRFLPLALLFLQKLPRFPRLFLCQLLAACFSPALLLPGFGFDLRLESFRLGIYLPLNSRIQRRYGLASSLKRRQGASFGIVPRGKIVETVGLGGILWESLLLLLLLLLWSWLWSHDGRRDA